MKKKLNIIVFALFASTGLVKAQAPAVMVSDKTGWHQISETTVDFTKEHDEVSVLIADRFAAIQFKVEDASIDLISAEVAFESGDNQKIDMIGIIPVNGMSKVIDLKGGERNIKNISFYYKTLPNSKDLKAHLVIMGLKTNTDEKKEEASKSKKAIVTGTPAIAETSIMMSDSKGWHKIGSRTVDFTKDTDEIIVVGADRFSSLKFKAVDASISLMHVEVYYENGTKQEMMVNSILKAGTESKAIALNGKEKEIKKIVFQYKTIPNQTADKAEIEVWGLKSNLTSK